MGVSNHLVIQCQSPAGPNENGRKANPPKTKDRDREVLKNKHSGSDEAAYYETHSSDWRCQDCGGPQRHADCVISSHEQVIQRHVGPRFSNRGYPASGEDGVAAGAAKNLRTDCVLSDDGQIADFRPTTGGLLSSERGGGAAGSAATPHTPALRRDQESVHCDMPNCLNADLLSGGGEVAAGTSSITDRSLLARDTDSMDYDIPDGLHAVLPMPPRPHPETVASLAPLMDDMLIDQDSAPPARPVNSTPTKKPRRQQQNRETKKRHRDPTHGLSHRKLETKRQ